MSGMRALMMRMSTDCRLMAGEGDDVTGQNV